MSAGLFIQQVALVLVVGLLAHLLIDVGVWAVVLRALGRTIEKSGYAAFVAVRHLRGHRRGVLAFFVLLSTLGVSVSSCMLTSVISIMGGFGDDLRSKIVGNNAHIVVDSPGGRMDDGAEVAQKVRRVEGVVGAMAFVSGEVMISSQTNLSGVLLKGIDTRNVRKVIDLPSHLEEGKLRYLDHPEELVTVEREFEEFERTRGRLLPSGTDDSPDASTRAPDGGGAEVAPRRGLPRVAARRQDQAPPDAGSAAQPDAAAPKPDELFDDPFLRPRQNETLPGVIIGRELARNLRLHVSDEVNIVSPLGDLGPTGPVPKSRPFRVAGVFYTGMYEFDSKYAYVTIPVAQHFLNLGRSVTGVEARVENVERAEVQTRVIRKMMPGRYRVRNWKDLNRSLFMALALEKVAMFVALSVATVIAAFSIVATLSLMVRVRSKEIAILKSLGTVDSGILRIFMMEGLLIGLVGSIAGIVLGAVTCLGIKFYGFKLDAEVYYIDRLPVHMSLVEFILVGLAATAISIIATLYPSYAASRLRPVDGLRND